jgi:glyoxylase-like metal-dependent hydrolase (beta-lactamase superfamily II)
MNALEHELHYPLADRLPAAGGSIEVAPGVLWLRMPLPFALDHINLWLLRDEIEGRAGWTAVDCGIDSPQARSAWEAVLANQTGGLPLLRVIVTHMHPDHMGLAHWLTRRFSTGDAECRLWMSATDYQGARLASTSTTGFGGDSAASFMQSHGLVDPDSLQKVRARSNYYASMVPDIPATYRRLLDGDVLHIGGRDWRCHVGHGHSPEHMSLHCASAGVLISGDMVLPRISTNVSVIDLEPEGNPLALYLASIERMRPLPADTLVLPSHGKPFTGLHARIDQLKRHHDERLAELMHACAAAPQTAAGVLDLMFKRKLDLHQTTFAMGEAIAHLNLLWLDGRLRRTRADDSAWHFTAA